jgi:hypothetical protein
VPFHVGLKLSRHQEIANAAVGFRDKKERQPWMGLPFLPFVESWFSHPFGDEAAERMGHGTEMGHGADLLIR